MNKIIFSTIVLFLFSYTLYAQNEWENSGGTSTRTEGSVAIGQDADLINKRKLNIWTNDGSAKERVGIFNYLNSSGGNSDINKYGIYNSVTGSGNATKYGIYNQIGGNNAPTYGLYSSLTGGTNNYGIYSFVDGINNYAIYAESSSNNSYAALFDGLVEFKDHLLFDNSVSNFKIHTQWQSNLEPFFKISPIINGVTAVNRSLELQENGRMIKYVENDGDAAFSIKSNTDDVVNFEVLGNGQVLTKDQIIFDNSVSNFKLHTEWQSGSEPFFSISPIINGATAFSKSLKLEENGELKKIVENEDDWAFTIKLYGAANKPNFGIKGSGQVYARAIKVQIEDFYPDYVFEPSYDLMPLKQLEAFIKKNKHLPNIPPAKEVEKSGLDLGSIAVKQMEKIEELTLYIIDLNKELETLKEEVKKLKEE